MARVDAKTHINKLAVKWIGPEAFKQHRKHLTHFYEVLTGWEGLEANEDYWEPIKIMHEDVPAKLKNYVSKAGDKDLSEYVARLVSKTRRANPPAAPGPIVQLRKSTKPHSNKTKPSRQLSTKRDKRKQGALYKHA
ncbi:unnamed protein product [Phytophthora fragariaefolia]|uniref:Unnamed protein product n=1 Tax=Phytophthora fragariaefolia TaxID=1490495 RepID=A0A9W7CY48_9STRA|nr:unnamed protein product [Phytophthora fragariaefolia]